MIPRARNLAATALILLALSACDEAATPVSDARAPAPILKTANAEPGPRNVPAGFAKTLLQTTCIDTLPDFDGATAALARAGGFVQSAQTGTFFHQQYDLSVKVVPGRCSMVTGVSGRTGDIARLSQLDGVRSGVPRVFGGRSYLSFYVSGA